MSIPKDAFSAENRPPGSPRKYVSWSLPLRAAGVGFTEATSNDARGCSCANAIQRGASEPASISPHKTIVLATTPVADARSENVRPPRKSISTRSPMRDLLPKIPTASMSRDSVRIGFLRMIYDEGLDGTFRRFEFQPELLLQGREQGWPLHAGRRRSIGIAALVLARIG